jgi:hypothetical protein
MKRGASFGYVNYEKILKSGKVEYLGKQCIAGKKCYEYQTTFPDRTYRDAKICLGAQDDLPYRLVDEEYTATYNFDPVEKLAVPVVSLPTTQ